MYDKEQIHDNCLKVISEEQLTKFTHLEAYIEPALSTLYEWELEKSEAIKRALSNNRIAIKVKMRKKWRESDNATLQLAAYKLEADEEELSALTMNKVDADLNHKGGITVISRPAQYETK